MIYIYKDTDGVHKKLTWDHTTDATYNNLNLLYDLKGQFGRHEYADAWIGFYNGEFDRTELRKKLDL